VGFNRRGGLINLVLGKQQAYWRGDLFERGLKRSILTKHNS
jgi:hypothetical protein